MGVDVDKAIAELKSKMDCLPGAENKLTMVVMSGDLDKHLAAMIIATGAAAMGMKVVLFFTFWGTAALRAANKKVNGKNFMGRMFGMMLPKGRNKLTLSQMNMAGMGTAMLKGLMKKKNVASLDQLYEVAAQLAVKIYICEMSMDLMGMKREEMIDYPELEVCGVATMLSHAKESAIQFFI
ncbi:MAG TPA: DsrE/DsrF/DrsH-like family protein [Spirochaetia bacterium]|nr:DsrE/DsrF/DrsH-like family protein [Spirochaetia bacterium]HTZ50349.1 DsrE/DsrF/DrsH-like family protein [Spirochaetia bacterium]